MITMYASKAGESAKAYFFSGLMYGDSTSQGQERVGDWWGKGAELLGLVGKVTTKQFCRLVDNMHPFTRERLTLRTDADRRAGFDLTFSPCKSFSIVALMLDDTRLLDALMESVKTTITEAETLVQTRVRKDGAIDARYTANLTAALFQHLTARPESGQDPDPQVHVHAYLINATFDVMENVWKAMEPQELARHRPYLESLFHNDLARRVIDLGYEVEASEHNWEIKGVPKEAIKNFSKRDERIQRERRARGIDDPREAADLARKTRSRKASGQSLDELRTKWWEQLPPKVARSLRGVKPGRSSKPRFSPERARKVAAEIVSSAARSSFERSSTVREQTFVGTCLDKSLGRVTAADIRAALAASSLEVRHYRGSLRVTHPEVYREEKEIISTVAKGKGRHKPLSKEPQPPEGLTRDQSRAYSHILSSRDQFITIEGRAGTGKTRLARSSTDAMQGELRKFLSPFIGEKVVVLAPQTMAARVVLREDGFKEAETVAKFLHDNTLQSRAAGGWVWVDEAGQLGTREARELVDTIERVGARAVFAGDRKQTRSATRGRAFDLMIDEAGCRTPKVEEIVRQTGRMREIVETVMNGNIDKAFRAIENDKNLIVDSEISCKESAAEDYVTRRKAGEKVAVITPTHRGAEDVSSCIRRRLKEDGTIKRESTVRTWVDTHLTAEERRDPAAYKLGQMVQFNKPTPGFERGVPYEVVNVAPLSFGPFKHQVIVRAAGEVAEALPMKYADRWSLYDPKEIALGIGDDVRITRTMMTHTVLGRARARVIEQFELPQQEAAYKKTELANGTRHTITGRTLDGHFVLKGGKILDKDCGHFTHGYCTTAHSSQSLTADTAILVGTKDQTPAIDARSFLVAATRPRTTLRVYTDDREALVEAAGRAREEIGAFELLERGEFASSAQSRRAREHADFETYREWKRTNDQEHGHGR